jgi:hypothetical protein
MEKHVKGFGVVFGIPQHLHVLTLAISLLACEARHLLHVASFSLPA